jgi:hypothetical protein
LAGPFRVLLFRVYGQVGQVAGVAHAAVVGTVRSLLYLSSVVARVFACVVWADVTGFL